MSSHSRNRGGHRAFLVSLLASTLVLLAAHACAAGSGPSLVPTRNDSGKNSPTPISAHTIAPERAID
jgi:hypothetical protein